MRSRRAKQGLWIAIFVLPALIMVGIFIIAPLFGGVLGNIIRFSIGLFGFVDISFDFRKEHKKKIL